MNGEHGGEHQAPGASGTRSGDTMILGLLECSHEDECVSGAREDEEQLVGGGVEIGVVPFR